MSGILDGKNAESIKLLLDLVVTNLRVFVEVWANTIDFNTEDEWIQAWRNIGKQDLYGVSGSDRHTSIRQYLTNEGVDTTEFNYKNNNDDAICLLRDAIGALLNYDCADMLDCDVAEVALLARLGDTAAVLIYPACVAIHNIKEQMSSAWDHLPNAKYIDLVIASLKANPDEWSAARDAAWTAAMVAAWDAAWDAARDAARTAARDTAWTAAWNAAWYAARNAAREAARDTIVALIAYDDCAHMLDSEPDDLRILSKLGSQAATLMIPAAVAFKLIKEKELSVL